jgi:hypothetical protein
VKIISSFYIKQRSLFYLSLVYLIILLVWYFTILNNSTAETLFEAYPDTFYFKPYISIYFTELIKNSQLINVFAIFAVVVIPYLIFTLLFRVYSFFVESKYAFLFSLLSVSVYNEKNFRDFLYDIIQMNFLENLTLEEVPLIFTFPFPSLSTLMFLALMVFIISIKKKENKAYWGTTILTALFFYINALDAIFILFLWFFVVFFVLYEKNKIKLRIYHFLIAGVVLAPGILNNTLAQNYQDTTQYDYYNLVLYNIIPLLLSVLFFKIKRIDPREVWFKFKYIYLLLFLEIIINLFVYSGLFIIDLDIMNRQALQFVIHLLYYTPIIYYVSRQSVNYRFGSESNKLSIKLSNFFFNAFVKSKKLIFYLLLILLFLFNTPLIIFV